VKSFIEVIIFGLSIAALAFGAGVFAASRALPPATALMGAYNDTVNIIVNWRNEVGLEPTQLLVSAPVPHKQEAVAALMPERMAPGLRIISGLTSGRSALMGVHLMTRDGTETHYWPVDYGLLDPGGRPPRDTFLHGLLVFPDGSIVVNFDGGDVLARLDPCGKPLWVTKGKFHHVVNLSPSGTLWTWETEVKSVAGRERFFENLVELDAANGHRIRSISLENDIIAGNDAYSLFATHTDEFADRIQYCCDPFHANDVEPLPAELAGAFPMFEAGDLLVSFRSLNMVAVIDPNTVRIKWHQIGPWYRQHDPDFLPDGSIAVFDNRMGLGYSRILRVDPATHAVRLAFQANPPEAFYSWRRGKQQILENGNILITESERGRVLEATPDGQFAWIYTNIYDGKRNGLTNAAEVLPDDYFAEGALNCADGQQIAGHHNSSSTSGDEAADPDGPRAPDMRGLTSPEPVQIGQ